MEEPFTSKKRRKSSFYRKSLGVSEFGDENNVSGITSFNFTNSGDSTVSSRGSRISPRQIEKLQYEAKQWKELLKDLKNRYQNLKSEEFSAIDWVREGPCLTENDRRFIRQMPDYNKIFKKHEELKETMLIAAATRAKLDAVTEEFLEVIETKLLDQKSEIIKKLSTEVLKTSDILGPLKEPNDSSYMLDPFLSDSDSEHNWEKINSWYE